MREGPQRRAGRRDASRCGYATHTATSAARSGPPFNAAVPSPRSARPPAPARRRPARGSGANGASSIPPRPRFQVPAARPLTSATARMIPPPGWTARACAASTAKPRSRQPSRYGSKAGSSRGGSRRGGSGASRRVARDRREAAAGVAEPEPGPRGEVVRRRRAVAAEVAPRQLGERGVAVGRRARGRRHVGGQRVRAAGEHERAAARREPEQVRDDLALGGEARGAEPVRERRRAPAGRRRAPARSRAATAPARRPARPAGAPSAGARARRSARAASRGPRRATRWSVPRSSHVVTSADSSTRSAPRVRSATRAARGSCAWTASSRRTTSAASRSPGTSSCAAARRRRSSATLIPRRRAGSPGRATRPRGSPRCASCQAPLSRSARSASTSACLLVVGHQREDRDVRPHDRVEVRLRPAPVRHQEPVAAVVRDRDHLEPGRPERGHRLAQRRDVERPARHVVAGEPERLAAAAVPLQQDGAARHPAQLAQTGVVVGPVVVGEDRHRRVERAVGERQRPGDRVDHRRRPRRPLRAHHRRRLDGGDGAVARLVVPGPRADVEHRLRVAQRGPDLRRDPRVLSARRVVRAADPVVAGGHGSRPRARRIAASRSAIAASASSGA